MAAKAGAWQLVKGKGNRMGQRARAALKLHRELGSNGTLKEDVPSVPVFELSRITRSDDAYAPGGE